MKKLFSKEDDRYIIEHYKHTTYAELAKHFGLTERQVRGHINNMGLTKMNKKDDSYFDVIDTEEKSYWLGFLFADGWVYENHKNRSYTVGIEIQSKHIEILKMFSAAVGLPLDIKRRIRDVEFNGYSYQTDTCCVRIYSRHMVESLIRHGIVQDKTHSLIYPHVNNFHNDFIRGFMDGDGCICEDKNGRFTLSFTNPNYLFLEYINDVFLRECGVHGSIYKEKDLKYRLTLYGNSIARDALNWLYSEDNGLHLERKYNIYKSHFGLAA